MIISVESYKLFPGKKTGFLSFLSFLSLVRTKLDRPGNGPQRGMEKNPDIPFFRSPGHWSKSFWLFFSNLYRYIWGSCMRPGNGYSGKELRAQVIQMPCQWKYWIYHTFLMFFISSQHRRKRLMIDFIEYLHHVLKLAKQSAKSNHDFIE